MNAYWTKIFEYIVKLDANHDEGLISLIYRLHIGVQQFFFENETADSRSKGFLTGRFLTWWITLNASASNITVVVQTNTTYQSTEFHYFMVGELICICWIVAILTLILGKYNFKRCNKKKRAHFNWFRFITVEPQYFLTFNARTFEKLCLVKMIRTFLGFRNFLLQINKKKVI